MKNVDLEYESSYYLRQYESNELKISETAEEPYAYMAFGEGDSGFDIYLPLSNGKVSVQHMEAAKFVLSQVVEMDQVAKAVPSEEPVYQRLIFIQIGEEIEFRYASVDVNATWSAFWVTNQNGNWEFDGLG
ncbi:hypothetical protein NBRC116493_03850 [Aurantivibrio infirmus]